MTRPTAKVCVIGAGVVGCAVAYELLRAGHTVMVADERAGAGLATPFANGAQLGYSDVEPLANPLTSRGLPKLFLAQQSPTRLRFAANPQQ